MLQLQTAKIRICYKDAAARALPRDVTSDEVGVVAIQVWPQGPVDHNFPDVVVLEAATPVAAIPLPLVACDRSFSIECQTRGYPQGADVGGEVREFPNSGKRNNFAADDPQCIVEMNTNASHPDEWKGLSGAPVVEKHGPNALAITGVIVLNLSAFGTAQFLQAVPVQVLEKKDGFRASLFSDWRAHTYDPEMFRVQLEKTVENIIEDLLQELSDQEREHYFRNSSCSDVAKQLIANTNDEVAKLIERFNELLRHGDDNAMRLGRIAQAANLLLLNPDDCRMVSYLAQNAAAGLLVGDRLAAHAHSRTRLEMISAALDQQGPDYRARETFRELPKSRWAIDVARTKVGADRKKLQSDQYEDIANRSGADLNILGSVTEYISGDQFRILDRETARRLDGRTDLLIRLIAQGLQIADTEDRFFYLVIDEPPDQEATPELLSHIRELLTKIECLRAFVVSRDPEKELDEFDDLAPMVKSVPIRT